MEPGCETPDRVLEESVPPVSGDARRFARLARHLAENGDRSTAGQAIAEAAVEVVGCTCAAVAHLERGDRVRFGIPGAGVGSIVTRIAAIVDEVGEAPALTAVDRLEVMVSADLTREPRWPEYAARVVAQTPIRSVMVFPLHLHTQTFGVLVLYADRPGFFVAGKADLAAVYADHATVVLARALAAEQSTNLRVALESNRAIGQAIGILMSRYRIREADAFDILRLASQATHRKVREIAQDVVVQGDIPDYLEGRPSLPDRHPA